MKVAVRYYSRSGNTKAVAEAIARAAETAAVSVDRKDAGLTEQVDILFIGGALYAYGIDRHLKEYLKTLKPGCGRQAVVFSTSWVSRHAIDLIGSALAEAGVPVAEEAFYVKGKPSAAQQEEAAAFARRFL